MPADSLATGAFTLACMSHGPQPFMIAVNLLTVGLPFVIYIAVLPAVIAWRTARKWRMAVPAERRRPQYQLLEIICVWFLFSPAIALMAGRADGLLGDPQWRTGSLWGVGVGLAFYMALGAYAGWAYARFRTRGELPSPWRSCALMAAGSHVPPALGMG